ncbi:MAG: ribonuclease H-like domain-containing protein [Thermoflexales bacterium]
MELEELRRRLRRLNVVRVAVLARTTRPCARPPAELQTLSLEARTTPAGMAWVNLQRYPLSHRHGEHVLHESLSAHEGWRAFMPETPHVREVLFLDLEATGLANGSGTLAFLIGLGYFNGTAFVVEQLFLRDPAEEQAMLMLLEQRLASCRWLVTFNGRAFDVPVLQARFVIARLPSVLDALPHLDLLPISRAIWRQVLSSCRLGVLEQRLLGVKRSHDDVPSALIPQLYQDYLRGQADLAGDMRRVMYHNAQDVLSMVVLWTRIGSVFATPRTPNEHMALGHRWERMGELMRAEHHYRAAVTAAEQVLLAAQRKLARALKRQARHEEAFPYWCRLADAGDVEGMVEAARHLERWRGDPCAALAWLERAFHLPLSDADRSALEQRCARLRHKCAQQTSAPSNSA